MSAAQIGRTKALRTGGDKGLDALAVGAHASVAVRKAGAQVVLAALPVSILMHREANRSTLPSA